MSLHTPVLEPDNLFIDALMTDVDGIHCKAKYDTTGMITSGPDEDTDHHFELIREYNKDDRNIPIILTSGRSLSQMRGIAKRSGNKNFMVAEGGMVFYDPSTDTKSTIFEKIPEYNKYLDSVAILAQMRGYLGESNQKMVERMLLDGKKTDRIILPEGKEAMVTVDLPYDGLYGDQNVPRVDRLYTLSVVLENINSDHRKLLYTKQEEFRKIIPASDGMIEVHVDASAVNIRPPISKPDAIAHIISEGGPLNQKYKIADVSKVGLIDDRDDQAIIKMRGIGGKVYTVANASQVTIDTVKEAYKSNGFGYVSPYNDIRGFRDVLVRVNKSNPWATVGHRDI